jgi:riboflavin kinase / FMN adenylyltransferase
MPSSFTLSRNPSAPPQALAGATVAVGNFDGLHRGHQHLIGAARDAAQANGRPSAVLTFEPHPRTWFNPQNPVFRLTPEPVKLAILEQLGLDGAFVETFGPALAALSPEEFVGSLLVGRLGVGAVVAGHDFRFGRGRSGNPEQLAALCGTAGISCLIVPAVSAESEIISSTLIRRLLEEGRVHEANRLLGYRWLVRASVQHGDKRGRILGYPTANLRLDDDCRLRHGIYAVRVRLDNRVHDGVASFGRRPTFDDGAPLLEVHLFAFEGDLYGSTIDVEFVAWIRGEERFASVEALIARMDRDSQEARDHLRNATERSFIAAFAAAALASGNALFPSGGSL